MSDKKVYDKAGQEIVVGSWIVYGHALGRASGLRFGRVLAIKWKPDQVYNREKQAWEDTEVPVFQVRGVDDDWGSKEPKLLKKSQLYFPDRILVISPMLMSSAAVTLLRDV